MPWEVVVEGGMLDAVDSFCYLGDTMSCVGGAEAAVRARIVSVWRKWRELVSLLVSQNLPLVNWARVYCACVRLVLLYAAETRVLTGKLEGLLVRCNQRMLRYVAKVRWQDRVSNEEVQRRCGVEDLEDRLSRARLRWFGHVRRREEGHILRVGGGRKETDGKV